MVTGYYFNYPHVRFMLEEKSLANKNARESSSVVKTWQCFGGNGPTSDSTELRMASMISSVYGKSNKTHFLSIVQEKNSNQVAPTNQVNICFFTPEQRRMSVHNGTCGYYISVNRRPVTKVYVSSCLTNKKIEGASRNGNSGEDTSDFNKFFSILNSYIRDTCNLSGTLSSKIVCVIQFSIDRGCVDVNLSAKKDLVAIVDQDIMTFFTLHLREKINNDKVTMPPVQSQQFEAVEKADELVQDRIAVNEKNSRHEESDDIGEVTLVSSSVDENVTGIPLDNLKTNTFSSVWKANMNSDSDSDSDSDTDTDADADADTTSNYSTGDPNVLDTFLFQKRSTNSSNKSHSTHIIAESIQTPLLNTQIFETVPQFQDPFLLIPSLTKLNSSANADTYNFANQQTSKQTLKQTQNHKKKQKKKNFSHSQPFNDRTSVPLAETCILDSTPLNSRKLNSNSTGRPAFLLSKFWHSSRFSRMPSTPKLAHFKHTLSERSSNPYFFESSKKQNDNVNYDHIKAAPTYQKPYLIPSPQALLPSPVPCAIKTINFSDLDPELRKCIVELLTQSTKYKNMSFSHDHSTYSLSKCSITVDTSPLVFL
ncbi:hypothetical protein AX774_g2111 [Zancudomyces culisetae]|uniref:Uncharacterized protein n=1 Tax=Zancudomyces culisetae TaxID=1213189 RepID=A0A1R1PTN3_ZANCU|nr:hypothetical protein AX774_g2111 [Zancudomyces culisetae]|eukprot:OMH84355.1 hypothetical protein AX774_g2111 [Zancudomyces culisetae]